MSQVRVYDLPTRLFHWLFAGFFLTAFTIANLVDDESARFPLHMLAGLGMVFVLLLRMLWSFAGTRHARWDDLTLHPAELLAYLKGVLTTGGRRWLGHNPASSWAALAMACLALGLGGTGIAMATGAESHTLKEVHELLANAFLVVVLLHVAGLVVHAVRHRDRLPAAMFTGNKPALASERVSVSARPIAGFAFVAMTGLFSGYLLEHYDAQARTLAVFGTTLQLGTGDGAEADEDRSEGGERASAERPVLRGGTDD